MAVYTVYKLMRQEGSALKHAMEVSGVSHFPRKDDPNTAELQWKSTSLGIRFKLGSVAYFLGDLTSRGLDFLRCKVTKLH